MPSAKRRAEWLSGRLAAKLAVASLLPGRPSGARALSTIVCRATRAAPPSVRALGSRLSFRVSLSHSGAWAVAAASMAKNRQALGIDLQSPRRIPRRGYRFFIRRDERVLLNRIGPLAMWSLKEAAYKALAPPDGVALTEIRIVVSARGLSVRFERRARTLAQRCGLRSLRLGMAQWRGSTLAWAC